MRDIQLEFNSFETKTFDKTIIKISCYLILRYRRDRLTSLYSEFPSRTELNTIRTAVQAVLTKTPENVTDLEFKYNKMIPTIVIARAINIEVEKFYVNVVDFHLNQIMFSNNIEQRFIDDVTLERQDATKNIDKLIQTVSGQNSI